MWSPKRAKATQVATSEQITLPKEELKDETLMQAITSGAMWAMELLYDRYNRLLYSFAYRMVADHQIAEDLLQESFIAAWKQSKSYSQQAGTVRIWLF